MKLIKVILDESADYENAYVLSFVFDGWRDGLPLMKESSMLEVSAALRILARHMEEHHYGLWRN